MQNKQNTDDGVKINCGYNININKLEWWNLFNFKKLTKKNFSWVLIIHVKEIY